MTAPRDDELGEFLAAYRAVDRPTPNARAATWAAIERRLADDVDLATPRRRARLATLAALAAAVALCLGLAAAVARQVRPDTSVAASHHTDLPTPRTLEHSEHHRSDARSDRPDPRAPMPRDAPSPDATPFDSRDAPSSDATPFDPRDAPSSDATPFDPRDAPSSDATPFDPRDAPSSGATPFGPRDATSSDHPDATSSDHRDPPLDHRDASSSEPRDGPPLAPLAPSPAPPDLAPSASAPLEPAQPRANPRIRPRPASSPALSPEEVASFQRAQAALAEGRDAAALAALDAHGRRFPGGIFEEERLVSRATALCRLGRLADARAARDRFLADRPASHLAGRMRRLCRENE